MCLLKCKKGFVSALATRCLSSFLCLFIFLTLLFSFVFFSFLGSLLTSSLISTALAISYTASVISGKEFLSLRWFATILLALCFISSLSFISSVFLFPHYHLLLLSSLSPFVLGTTPSGLHLLPLRLFPFDMSVHFLPLYLDIPF